jgi:hypothetical protein
MRDPKGPVKSYKSPDEIAKKHKVPLKTIMNQVKTGTKIEGEHTTSKSGARITALQHVDELPDYYTRLKKIEKVKEENLNYENDTKYCLLCRKNEKQNECAWGPKMWDRYTIAKIHPANESVENSIDEGIGTSITKALGNPPLLSKRMKLKHALIAREISKTTEKNKKRKFSGKAANPQNESYILEDHKEIASGKKRDDEGYMARIEFDQIERSVNILRKLVKKGDQQLPAWVQSKITRAADFIDTAAEYLSSDEDVSEGKTYSQFITEVAAWQRKEGKNREGGLNEKGRKSYERENPGSDLKAPSKKVGNPRRASFCARMSGMKKKLTSKKTANDPNSRINKSLRAWNC